MHDGLTVVADAAPADEALVRELDATHVVPRGDGFASAVRALYPSGVDPLIDAALVGPPALAAVRDGGQLITLRDFQGESERDITIERVNVTAHLHDEGAGALVAELADLGPFSALIERRA